MLEQKILIKLINNKVHTEIDHCNTTEVIRMLMEVLLDTIDLSTNPFPHGIEEMNFKIDKILHDINKVKNSNERL